MCGFRHSTFFTTPVTDTGLVRSYSDAKEWWAMRRGAARITRAAAHATLRVFMWRSPLD
jgi:hypothetical protein